MLFWKTSLRSYCQYSLRLEPQAEAAFQVRHCQQRLGGHLLTQTTHTTKRQTPQRDRTRTVDAVLGADDLLEGVVRLRADLHRLSERRRASRHKHELLERELIARMRTAVDDVERRARQDVRRLDAGEVREVLVEGDALLGGAGIGDGNGDAENGVGAELALIGAAVELDQEVVDLLLLRDLEARLDQLGRDRLVDVRDGLEHTCRDDHMIRSSKDERDNRGAHPCRRSWPCRRHGAQRPRVHR